MPQAAVDRGFQFAKPNLRDALADVLGDRGKKTD
jgi:hypothetical protein